MRVYGLRLNHERDRDVRRLLDVTAHLFDRADDAHLEIRVLGVGSAWPGPPRTQRGDGGSSRKRSETSALRRDVRAGRYEN